MRGSPPSDLRTRRRFNMPRLGIDMERELTDVKREVPGMAIAAGVLAAVLAVMMLAGLLEVLREFRRRQQLTTSEPTQEATTP